jgi:16S rRNA processing protein RimM
LKDRPEYVVVGRFGRPRGISGEIYLRPLTDNPGRFRKKETLWMDSEDGLAEIEIVSVKIISGKSVAKVAGIDSPEQAGHLTNRYIYIKGADLGDLPEGTYYHFDLMGCRVVDSDNRELGRLADVETYPANDAWVVETGKGRRVLFPAVEHFIKKIDIEKKLIIVDPPEGIFDSPDED